MEPIMRPLGFDWKTDVSLLAGISAKEVVVSTMKILYSDDSTNDSSLSQELIQHKDSFSQPIALSLLAFIMLYVPCIGTIAAVGKESKWKWAVFLAIYTTVVAYVFSFLVFNISKLII
jgi:ferrous iron transport protein B